MKGVSGKKWILLSENIKPPSHLVEKFGYIVAQLLANRNFVKHADLIFDVKLKNLIPYDRIPNIDVATERIKEAIRRGERIVIYGDYDVDGITSTAILYDFLRRLGARVVPVVPSRNMGYGLNRKVSELISRYADLLITVDNGTSAVSEINSMDIDVIVVDHHNPQSILPKAVVVNPKIGENVPKELKEVSSSALSFYIVASLRNELGIDIDIRSYIDLVALGTVADVMPLNYLNRIFVVKGLEFFNKILEGYEGKAGIRALLEVSNLERVSFRDIGFQLAPRINSAGRIGDPRLSLRLLLEEKPDRALYYARKLEMLNIYRRRLSENILKEASAMTDGRENFICVGSEGWHPGVLGIVAGRLTSQFAKPSGVFAFKSNKAVGSIRSVEGVDIYSVISEIKDMFLKWGGHSNAVGVTLPVERFSEFKEYVDERLKDKERVLGVLEIDMRLDFRFINKEHSDMIKCLQPFGEGNTVPTFMTRLGDIKVERISKTKLRFLPDDIEMRCFDNRIMDAVEGGAKYIVYAYDGDSFELIDASSG